MSHIDGDLTQWAVQVVDNYRERALIRKARLYGRIEGAAWVLLPLLLVAVAWLVTR